MRPALPGWARLNADRMLPQAPGENQRNLTHGTGGEGSMTTRSGWLAYMLIGACLWTPASARAQYFGRGDLAPSWEFPLPLRLDHRESGFYTAFEGLAWRLDNPLRPQVLARRGFFDESGFARGQGDTFDLFTDGTRVGGSGVGNEFLGSFFVAPGPPGRFFGSGEPALSTTDVGGDKWEPGFRLTLGYRFQNGLAVEVVLWRLADFRHTASAGILPANFNVFNDFANSFVTAPFFNFPSLFAGPSRDVLSNVLPFTPPAAPNGTVTIDPQTLQDLRTFRNFPIPAFGIWNAADNISIDFEQRTWGGELTFRLPVYQDDILRTYVLAGPRLVCVWERFRLRAEDADLEGNILPSDVALYTNKWENQMWGAQTGIGGDVYLGAGFALSFEGRVGLFANFRDVEVKMERKDIFFAVKRDDHEVALSPMFHAGVYLWWYPIDGVQVRFGYEFLGIFNTLRSTHPVDFNVGRLAPDFDERFMRFDGLSLGIAFIF